MTRQVVFTAESDSTQGVDQLINEHLKQYPDIEVKLLSSSSCWDDEKKYVQYITTILYTYEEK